MANFCTNCGAKLRKDDKFCGNCGTKIQNDNNFCMNCGTKLGKDDKFCINCGTRINGSYSTQDNHSFKSRSDMEKENARIILQ